jgi:hypothetical protein
VGNQESIPTSALATICEPPGSSIEDVVRQRVIRLAELIRKDGAPYPLTPTLVNVWVDVFLRAKIAPEQIEGAFDKAERQLKFWRAPAEVLGFISTAEENSAKEEASLKFQWVRDYIRLHYHPDLSVKSGPPITERVRRAIDAAGGLTHLSECVGDDLVFARKRFIESYLREGALKQDEYLLPAGEIENLFAVTARQISVTPLIEKGTGPKKQTTEQSTLSAKERLAVADALAAEARAVIERYKTERATVTVSNEDRDALRRQAEVIRQRYPKIGNLTGIPPELRARGKGQP